MKKDSTARDPLSDKLLSELAAERDDRIAVTLGDIYKSALRNYEKICPARKALPTVAGIIGISEKKLYRATKNEATLDVREESSLIVTTCFPQAFEMKKNLLFPQFTVQHH